MIKIITAITAFLYMLVNVNLFAQNELKPNSEQVYGADALYGYMNGGSELYKEYGFRKLTVQEYVVEGELVTAECYEMESPLMAFGIYSVNIYKCANCIDLNLETSCCNPYQVQAYIGNYYFSIINSSGSSAGQEANEKVFKYLLRVNEYDKAFELPSGITELDGKSLFYLNGELSIANRASGWLNVFRQLKLESCYLIKLNNSKASILVCSSNNKVKLDSYTDETILKKERADFIYLMRNPEEDDLAKNVFEAI